jgi:hypothetical protein
MIGKGHARVAFPINNSRVKDSNTIAGAKKDSYTIIKIYIP